MDAISHGGRFDAWIQRAAARPLTWLLIIGVMFGYPVARAIHAAQNMPERRPVIGTAPEFTLVDQNGDEVSSAGLRGRMWVASFTFVRCTQLCPKSMEAMSEIQHRIRGLHDQVRLLTFTVEPEVDTPEQFARYAAGHRASRRLWKFASGPPEQVHRVLEGFKVAPGPQTRAFLVDRDGKIRGVYELHEPAAVDLLLRDAGLIVNRGD